jgi:hypothetical protein
LNSNGPSGYLLKMNIKLPWAQWTSPVVEY